MQISKRLKNLEKASAGSVNCTCTLPQHDIYWRKEDEPMPEEKTCENCGKVRDSITVVWVNEWRGPEMQE